MKLIYPPTITIMWISYPRIKWVGSTIKEEKDEINLGGRQMDNTNKKCIFGNDLLQGTQSNVGFPAAVAVGFFGYN